MTMTVIPAYPGLKLIMPVWEDGKAVEFIEADIIAWDINPHSSNEDSNEVESAMPVIPGDQLTVDLSWGIKSTCGSVETIGGSYYKDIRSYMEGEHGCAGLSLKSGLKRLKQ